MWLRALLVVLVVQRLPNQASLAPDLVAMLLAQSKHMCVDVLFLATTGVSNSQICSHTSILLGHLASTVVGTQETGTALSPDELDMEIQFVRAKRSKVDVSSLFSILVFQKI